MLILLEWCAAFITWFLVRIQPVWKRVEPFLRLTILILVTLIVTFWIAVFSYLTLYYLYVPSAKIFKQLNFKFSSACKINRLNDATSCSFPKDNVSLFDEGNSMLSFGQSYKLFVNLEVPESKVNREIGMFMIGIKLFGAKNNIIQSEERSIMLEYKSELLESIDTTLFAFLYLFGDKRQKQRLTIEMFSDLKDNPYNKIHYCEATIYSPLLQYYSADIQFYANFAGIRSFMFYYPIFSAFCFVMMFFLSLNFLVLINWLHRQWVKLEATADPRGDWLEEGVDQPIKGPEEDSWPEPRPCAIAGEKITHGNYIPEDADTTGTN